MLKTLYIRNYALIETLELDFYAGLNIITGETGAGKSIIIGALGLILGNRADVSVLNKEDGKCIIEGTFDTTSSAIEKFLVSNELDVETELKIRREITVTGKSRAFINDTPVGLPILKELSSLLVDVNAQNQTYIFKSSEIQLAMLDEFTENKSQLEAFQHKYSDYISLKKQLKSLLEKEALARQQQDFLQFQFDELSEASLKEDEDDLLKSELQWMDNVEVIKQALFYATQKLNEADDNVISQLQGVLGQLSSLQAMHSDFKNMQERLQSSLIELQDIASEYEKLYEQTDFDPNLHNTIQARFDLLTHLQQKHRKQNSNELLELLSDLDQQLLEFSSLSDQINTVSSNLESQRLQLNKMAKQLSSNRKSGLKTIEEKVIHGLHELGMKDAIFKIEIIELPELSSTGIDKVDFLFSSNKGRAIDLISKIASGGELSRLVLTLKSLLSASRSLPTVIFDEIDTGVSGDIASKVGNTMKKMSENMQVIAITHLPQIAAKAKWHYKVYKKEVNEVTQSDILLMTEEERLHELALMISGDAQSKSAIKMAEELIG